MAVITEQLLTPVVVDNPDINPLGKPKQLFNVLVELILNVLA